MIINGTNYKMPELDFNAICTLEDMGVNLVSKDQKPLNIIRGFVALATGDATLAGREIEAHLAAGGKLDDIMKDINEAIQNSGFFRALGAGTTEGTSPGAKAEK